MNIDELYRAAEIEDAISNPNVAHLAINKDEVVGLNKVPGLVIETEGIEDGVKISLTLEEGTIIDKPVHLCFGMTDPTGVQHIDLHIDIQNNSQIGILSHCIFPRADKIVHKMDADISIGKDAEYTYLEKHIHSAQGRIKVVPKAKVELKEGAFFKTDFELIEGRAGDIDIEYETICKRDSVMEMTARVAGKSDDTINISEIGNLEGEGAKGVLTTRVAAKENAKAEVYNKLMATAPYTRGHVDCKEIIQDEGKATAVPVVEVNHPKAHVTHEAAIGSVDTKQLETLISRGLSEDEAVNLIIEGLLGH